MQDAPSCLTHEFWLLGKGGVNPPLKPILKVRYTEQAVARAIAFLFGVIVQKAGDTLRQLDKTVRKAMLTGMQGASDDVQSTGRDAVRQWRNKVDFKEEMTADLNRTELLIKPEGDKRRIKIFGYVDLGTKPHIITAKNPSGMLRFRTGYSARTMPVAKYNVGSGQSFGNWVQKQSVNHPGNAPRLFLKTFMEKMIPALEVRVQMSITKAVA